MRIRYVPVICIFLFFGTTTCLGQSSPVDLDSLVQRMMAQEGVVGASVLVARGDRILLHKGYGFADLGLEAPTKDETVYHVVGPMLPFTGIAVMQLMEREIVARR
jgi:CubicO group peptidase (beta-lactamase class C family)